MRDWKNDPKVIERYCDCTWRPARPEEQPSDPTRIRTIRDASKCPLHGQDSEHDTPEGW